MLDAFKRISIEVWDNEEKLYSLLHGLTEMRDAGTLSMGVTMRYKALITDDRKLPIYLKIAERNLRHISGSPMRLSAVLATTKSSANDI